MAILVTCDGCGIELIRENRFELSASDIYLNPGQTSWKVADLCGVCLNKVSMSIQTKEAFK